MASGSLSASVHNASAFAPCLAQLRQHEPGFARMRRIIKGMQHDMVPESHIQLALHRDPPRKRCKKAQVARN